MPKLPRPGVHSEQNAQDDPKRNPVGIYSGATKRLAISDGEFVRVNNVPKDTRNRGRLT